MNNVVEGLPPEIASQISTDWHKNEAEYWRQRESLMAQYQGQWVAFADNQVIDSDSSPVAVLHRGMEISKHPFVTCVGHENEPCRMRRTLFQYDSSYPGEPLPVLEVEFRKHPETPGVNMANVIPDTGADASVLPWTDCQHLLLDPADAIPALMGGVGGSSSSTIVFQA